MAVTGFGLVTPLGLDAESTWSRLLKGASAIEGRLLDTNHRVAIAALEAEDLVGVDDRARVVSDRVTLLGVSAAAMAMESARLSVGSRDKDGNIDAECMSIMVGTSFGGIGSLIQEDRRTRDGKARVSPRLVTRAIPSALASHLAIQYRITGPVMTYLGDCAASAQALGEAMVAILAGRSDRALVGGADSLFVDPLMLSLVAAGALATLGPEESAEGAVCPFGHGRRGMALGEGAAFFVLEREALARARGAAIHAFLVGYGAGNDAYHVTAPEPGGFGAERVMRMALRSANAVPTDIGYVSAHATGTMLRSLPPCDVSLLTVLRYQCPRLRELLVTRSGLRALSRRLFQCWLSVHRRHHRILVLSVHRPTHHQGYFLSLERFNLVHWCCQTPLALVVTTSR